MNPLQVLKDRLQNILHLITFNQTKESEFFINALEDGIYSTDLSVTALEQWIAIWTQTDSHCMTEDEITYQEGVEFVEAEWHKITGMF